jgi:hypothetical protein
MRKGDTFRGESICTNCRLSSSGLNLACEQLLLLERDEASKEFPDEARPCALTFADTIIVNTLPFFILHEVVISLNGGDPI